MTVSCVTSHKITIVVAVRVHLYPFSAIVYEAARSVVASTFPVFSSRRRRRVVAIHLDNCSSSTYFNNAPAAL